MSLADELLACPVPASPATLEAIVGDVLDFTPHQRFAPPLITLQQRPAVSSATIEGGRLTVDACGSFVVSLAAGGYSRFFRIIAFAPAFAPSARAALRSLVNDGRVPAAVIEAVALAPAKAVVELSRWASQEDTKPAPGAQSDMGGRAVERVAHARHICQRCSMANEPGQVSCERCGSRQFVDPFNRRYRFFICAPCGSLLVVMIPAGETRTDYDPRADESPEFAAGLRASGQGRGHHTPNYLKAAFDRANWLAPSGVVPAHCSVECRDAATSGHAPPAPPPPPAPRAPAPPAEWRPR